MLLCLFAASLFLLFYVFVLFCVCKDSSRSIFRTDFKFFQGNAMNQSAVEPQSSVVQTIAGPPDTETDDFVSSA